MHKILVIRLYFPLDVLHVSDCISPSSGETLIMCTSHFVYAGTISYSHTTARLIGIYQHIPAYTKCDVQLIKLLLMMD